MNPQANQAIPQELTPPYFQAVGSLTGQLSVYGKRRYRLQTVDGDSFPVRILGRMNKLVRGKSEFLGVIRSWRVYPRTNPMGELTSVHLIRLGSHDTKAVDEFQISGCVVPPKAEGLIGVKIKPNLSDVSSKKPLNLALPGDSFPPFYLTLHGYLPGNPVGELWRFACQRQGRHLEMIDGVRVKGRFEQSNLWKSR